MTEQSIWHRVLAPAKVNPFLEVSWSYEFTGTDHLWTKITRNGAGAVTQIKEPTTAAPAGYQGSTGGAVHEFELDVMGRVVEARRRGAKRANSATQAR